MLAPYSWETGYSLYLCILPLTQHEKGDAEKIFEQNKDLSSQEEYTSPPVKVSMDLYLGSIISQDVTSYG